MFLKPVPMYPGLSRAYELAIMTKQEITVYSCNENKITQGDYDYLKGFFSRVSFSANGCLGVELDFDSVRTYKKLMYGDSLAIIHERCVKALTLKKESGIDELPFAADARAMFGNMVREHKISLLDIEAVEKIAEAIAYLELKLEVSTDHLVEAVKYIAYKYDKTKVYRIAENNFIAIGNSIFILQDNLTSDEITVAYNYFLALL
jgi:hypothetical protein